MFEDKLRQEQIRYQKFEYDFTKVNHDHQTLQVMYHAL